MTQQTDSTPITRQTFNTSPGKEIRQYIESISPGHKLAIIAMHQKNYTTGDVQRAFREYLQLEISKEIIKDIIKQSDATSQLSMEQEKSTSTEIQKHPTRPSVIETDNPVEQQGVTAFPSDTNDVHDFPTQTEPINEQVMQQEEKSTLTAAENAGQVLNELAINEPINSTVLRSRSRSTRLTSPPSEPPFQLVPQPQSPSGVLTSSLLSSLNTLSPEEALSQLEALHASLPSLLDRHRQIVREIEEEKERKRREEEEQAQLAAEIAEQERLLEENTRELMERERAIREKNEQLAKLREKLRRRQTSTTGTRYSSWFMMVINSSSKESTAMSENKMSQLENGSMEGSQQRQSMAIETMQVSTEMAQTESPNNMASSNVSSEVSRQVLEDMMLESPYEKTIAMASDTENAKALIESPTHNGSRETSMETGLIGTDIPTKSTTIEEPIVEETTKQEMVTEEPEVESMETEEEPFSMIQVVSPEVMDRTDQADIQVVGLGMETGIQVVGSGGMTFSLPDYTSDNESGQSNDMHVDIPLQDRIRHDDEMAVDEKQSLSTRDSRSPSFERQVSPFQSISEDRPRGRRVTFTELTDDTKVTFPPPRVSVSVEKTTRFGQGDYVDGDHSPLMSLGERISTPPYNPFNATWSAVQSYRVVPPVHRLKISESSTVLLTNKFRDWSDYFVALDHDGNIDLLDSKTHCSVGSPPLLWKQEYTASAAINGAWIAPRELALVHADSRRNRGETEVTLVKYTRRAGSRWIKPRVTHLNPCPHGHNEKITAVEPLWEENDGKRVFATGGKCNV